MTRSVAALGAALRAGRTTSRAIVEQFLDRQNAVDGLLGSFVTVDHDRVLAEANRADELLAAGTDLGPMHGIPVGVKDIVNVAGYPTRCGSALYPDAPAVADADVVANLRRAGAIVAGKTTTHELACGVVSAPATTSCAASPGPGRGW